MSRLTIFITVCLATGTVQRQSILYVDDTATGADNGSGWCDAYVFLQDALAAASASGGMTQYSILRLVIPFFLAYAEWFRG